MNIDNNRRFQDTESKIFKAYGKLANVKELDRITVSDICREAQIHRTTFYGHFQDIVELEEKILRKQFYLFYQGFFNQEGKWSFHDGILMQVRFFYTYRKTIRKHLSSNSFERTLDGYLDKNMIIEHLSAYKQAFHCNTDVEVWYHEEFFIWGMMAIIRKWVMNDCPEPAEEIADMITKFCGMGRDSR